MKNRSLMTLAMLLPGLALAEGTVTLSSGLDYSTGKYGSTEKTDTVYIPLIAKYETGLWTLRITVPWVSITGPGGVVGTGGDRVTVGGVTGNRRTTESGLGDIVTGASYTVFERGGWVVDLGAKIKFGTGSESRGLGTGKHDLTLQADVYRSFGPASVFTTFGYKRMGDPDGVEFRNPVFASVGLAHKIGARTTAGLSYDWRDRLRPTSDPIQELTAFVSHRFSDDWKVQAYAVTGFSDASPDAGAGVIIGRMF
jgi:hypothetical protein